MTTKREHNDDRRDVDVNICCGETELLGVRVSRHFAVEAHQCSRCGDVRFLNARIDGQTFWVTAMGKQIQGMEIEIADEAGVMPPPVPPAIYDITGKRALRA